MKRNSKSITGFNAASILGLKALLAQEKAARAGKATSTPAPTSASVSSNPGVADRAKQDSMPEEHDRKPKKVTLIGGVAYVQGEDDWEPLVDVERKSWEEYERSKIWESNELPGTVEEQQRIEEAEEASKRSDRRVLLAELSQDTEKGREEHRTQIAKRDREKMARLELIQAKAKKGQTSSAPTPSTNSERSPTTTETDDGAEKEPLAKKPKLNS